MKEMRMTRIVCALVGLLVATTALAEVEESAKTEKVEPAPSTTALETRMEQLENSVAELTSRLRRLTAADGDSETNPSAEETTVTVTAAEYGALKIAVAEFSRELSELKDLSEANEPETVDDESENDASEQGIIQSPGAPDTMSEAYYLPSRSWAGAGLRRGRFYTPSGNSAALWRRGLPDEDPRVRRYGVTKVTTTARFGPWVSTSRSMSTFESRPSTGFAGEEGTPKDNDTFLTQFVLDF